MSSVTSAKTWLLLIHQIPPAGNALRVKIWRRLQLVGAVAIKQTVYAMPITGQSREDLSWILREIIEGGGEGSISQARFVEGLTDEQLVGLFREARKSDYAKLAGDASQLLADWTSIGSGNRTMGTRGHFQISKLQRRLDAISSIDFFQTPERESAQELLKTLAAHVSGDAPLATAGWEGLADLQGKVWVTRQNPFVDRLACGWLIRRFVDRTARFKLVRASQHIPAPGELRFDMFEGEFTHEGDRCTFEVMIRRFQLKERALVPVAEIVHDIDMKDSKYGRSETDGFKALLTGLVASHSDDHQLLDEGIRLFDTLFAYFRKRESGLGIPRR